MQNFGHQAPAYGATHHAPRLSTFLPGSARDKLHLWAATICVWFERSRQRRALAELDARMLRDIGVTSAQARREAATPFWSASKA
jgi:uncharacterized protein YjiS (DUF1127 family)